MKKFYLQFLFTVSVILISCSEHFKSTSIVNNRVSEDVKKVSQGLLTFGDFVRASGREFVDGILRFEFDFIGFIAANI